MSVTIRLSRTGKKNAPTYKVVVANTKDKRLGKAVEILGHYNPGQKTESFVLDKEKYQNWIQKGALVTEAVKKLIDGTYTYIKYEPNKKATE